ncbi:MAG: ATP-binding protein, partial [Myxococcota bacterium]
MGLPATDHEEHPAKALLSLVGGLPGVSRAFMRDAQDTLPPVLTPPAVLDVELTDLHAQLLREPDEAVFTRDYGLFGLDPLGRFVLVVILEPDAKREKLTEVLRPAQRLGAHLTQALSSPSPDFAVWREAEPQELPSEDGPAPLSPRISHLLSRMVASFPFGAMAVFDPDLRFVAVGGVDMSRMNLDPAAMVGEKGEDCIPPEAWAQLRPQYESALRGETVLNEVTVGGQCYLSFGAPIRSDRGEIIAGMRVAQNITRYTEVRARLEESESLLRETQRIARVGSWAFHLNTQTISWSEEIFRLFERDTKLGPPSEQEFYDLLGDEKESQAFRRQCTHAVESGEKVDFSVRIEPLGEPRWIRCIASLVRDASGAPVRLSGTLQDVTEQILIERERAAQAETLKQATARAEAGEKAKTEFLATMSHEMRTPLNGVLGSLSVLHETQLSAEQQDLLQTSVASSRALLTLIDDILDLSRLDHGEMQLDLQPTALEEVIEEALVTVSESARIKGLKLGYQLSESCPSYIDSDPGRLRQILVNLLGNGVKFTESGVVWLYGERRGHAFRLEVRDTGPGIPPEEVKRLFEPFSQIDGSTHRRYGGTGLGLAITLRLTAALGGEVWVSSQPGAGSSFFVELPLGGSPPEQDRPPSRLPPGLRVLIGAPPLETDAVSGLVRRLGGEVTHEGRRAHLYIGTGPSADSLPQLSLVAPGERGAPARGQLAYPYTASDLLRGIEAIYLESKPSPRAEARGPTFTQPQHPLDDLLVDRVIFG